MKRSAAMAAIVAAALGSACTDQPSPLAPPVAADPTPFLQIRDDLGAANPKFLFLAPIRLSQLQGRAGFNPDLRPVVEICKLTGAVCDPNPVRLTRTSGNALLNRVYVLRDYNEYAALWVADDLTQGKKYRISVLVGGQVLGFADLDVVRTLKDLLKYPDRGNFVPLLKDFILPIRFWIGNNALCTGTCSSKTITLAEGGTVELTTPVEHFTFDIPATTTATSGGQPVTDVTFTLETCSGIDVDLPKFGQCLRVTTRYGGAGINAALTLFGPGATVSMCVLEPGIPVDQEKLVTLHQQDGTLIRALPHVAPKGCTVLTARESESRGLATRGWHWVRDFAGTLFTPRPLFAGSRTAVFNLGGGGQTHALGLPPCPAASSMFRGMALATCVAASAPLMATPSPTSGHTISDFQFALPAKINYLDSETDPDRSASAGAAMVYKVSATDARYANIPDALEGVTTGGFLKFTITEGDITLPTVTVPVVGGYAQITRTLAAGSTTVEVSGVGFATPSVNGPLGTFDPFWPDYLNESVAGSTVTLLPATLVFHATGTVVTGGIYLIRDSDDMLQRLDPTSLAITNVGGLGIDYAFGDCAWNPANNTLYMVEGRAVNTLYTVNLGTGAATAIGVHGITDMFAIGYHPLTNAIYGAAANGNLYRMNLTTGAATLIGATGLLAGSDINGLAWDPVRSQFVALNANVGGGQLYSVDVATAAVTLLAEAGGIDNMGLTYVPGIDRFWAVDYQGRMFQYDPTAAYARTTLATGQGQHTCIAHVP